MSRVGIVTLSGYFNYGNRFQNYALQEQVRRMTGAEVVTLKTDPSYSASFSRRDHMRASLEANGLRRSMRKLAGRVAVRALSVARASSENGPSVPERARRRRIVEFSRNFIVETESSDADNETLRSWGASCDAVVAGSDQIWNPLMRYCNEADFLTFVPEVKRVAYAPSFGLSTLPKSVEERYAAFLDGFSHISVREDSGAAIVERLTGTQPLVVLDPTLLLGVDEWRAIESVPVFAPSAPFLLVFMLDQLSDRTRRAIRSEASERELEVVQVMGDESTPHFGPSPQELLWYLRNAAMVVTDSFHAVAFSLQFEVPFRVVPRDIMNTRIHSLLRGVGVDPARALWETGIALDWSTAERRLSEWRKASAGFLSSALRDAGV